MFSKLAIQKAEEMGAYIQISLHLETEEEAEFVAKEFSEKMVLLYEKKSHGTSKWFVIEDKESKFKMVIFYKNENEAGAFLYE